MASSENTDSDQSEIEDDNIGYDRNEKDSDNDGHDYDSDRELQIAFEKGWLKPGLNVVDEVPLNRARPKINNVTGLRAKLAEFEQSSKYGWIERMDITAENHQQSSSEATSLGTEPSSKLTSGEIPSASVMPSEKMTSSNADRREDDFAKEMSFYRQAQLTVREGLKKLSKLGIATKRPDDYYAEMAKSDEHMTKVRERLLNVKTSKERSEMAKKMREQRKFAAKVQHQVTQNRQKEKRKLLEAVKKHRKGFTEQLDDVLRDAKGDIPDFEESERRGEHVNKARRGKMNKKQTYKLQKFGFGGQKKRGKYNSAKDSADMSEYNPVKHSNAGNKGKKGKGRTMKRPGKQRRQQMKGRKKGGNRTIRG